MPYHPHMPFHEYAAIKALNWSTIKHPTALAQRAALSGGSDSDPLYSALHCALLEPGEFEARYTVSEGRRTEQPMSPPMRAPQKSSAPQARPPARAARRARPAARPRAAAKGACGPARCSQASRVRCRSCRRSRVASGCPAGRPERERGAFAWQTLTPGSCHAVVKCLRAGPMTTVCAINTCRPKEAPCPITRTCRFTNTPRSRR